MKISKLLASILTLVFGILGGIFAFVALMLFFHPFQNQQGEPVPAALMLVFAGMGAIFLLVALFIALLRRRTFRQEEELRAWGLRVPAQITALTPKLSISVNRLHPMVATAQCVHPVTGETVTVQSPPMMNPPCRLTEEVTALFDPEDPTRCMLDLTDQGGLFISRAPTTCWSRRLTRSFTLYSLVPSGVILVAMLILPLVLARNGRPGFESFLTLGLIGLVFFFCALWVRQRQIHKCERYEALRGTGLRVPATIIDIARSDVYNVSRWGDIQLIGECVHPLTHRMVRVSSMALLKTDKQVGDVVTARFDPAEESLCFLDVEEPA